jgi:hypothetical protein
MKLQTAARTPRIATTKRRIATGAPQMRRFVMPVVWASLLVAAVRAEEPAVSVAAPLDIGDRSRVCRATRCQSLGDVRERDHREVREVSPGTTGSARTAFPPVPARSIH